MPYENVARLPLFGTQHDPCWELCGPLQATGRRLSGDASGMVEIRNGNGVDGQLVEARAKRTTLIQPTARPAVSRIIPG